MRIITSQQIINKYNNPGIIDLIKTISPDVDVLQQNDFASVKAHCDTINDDILIYGGPDIIPFGTVLNPANDPDNTVLTDNPYGCTTDPSFLIPNKVVGRIPDEQMAPQFDYLQAVTASQVGYLNTKSTGSGWFNLVASVWKGISDYLNQTFQMNNQYVSPPFTSGTISYNLLSNKKFAYLNTHGSQQTPYFYGQQGNTYPIALQPTPGYFKGMVVFADACYGAWLPTRSRTTSIPLMALFSGTIGFVCSTAIAYGPSAPPASAADLLCQLFYQHLLAGSSLGQALMQAKQDFAAQTIRQTGALDPESKKTLLSFNLYGNPDIKI